MSQQKPSQLVRSFIFYTEEILDQLLKLPENERPKKAAELFNLTHREKITPKQAKEIGKRWYIEDGNIYPLTPEIAQLL